MKKVIITLISLIPLLAACAGSNHREAAPENIEKEADSTIKVEESSVKKETTDEETEQNLEPQDEEVSAFPEYDVLVEEVRLDNLDADVKINNPHKRIMILKDGNGAKRYKSIYIKKKNRLKIINLNDEGQIFNSVIE